MLLCLSLCALFACKATNPAEKNHEISYTYDEGENAFEYCDAMEEIVLPASVSCLETHAFGHCSSLLKIFYEGDAPAVRENVFVYCNSELTMHYVQGTAGWTDPAWQGCRLEIRNGED